MLMNPVIYHKIKVLGKMAKKASEINDIDRMRNGASMQNVDKPNANSKNLFRKKPLFSSPLNSNSPYNTN